MLKSLGTMLNDYFRQCCNAVPGDIISVNNQIYIISVALKAPANFTIRYIRGKKIIFLLRERSKCLSKLFVYPINNSDSTSNPLPKPPPAQWGGHGGITGLIGAENGVDNTWESVILKELPRTFQTFGQPTKNIFSDISRILQLFFNQQ